MLASSLGLDAGSGRRDLGRQSGPESRLPVAVAQSSDLEVRDRDEAIEPVARPQKIVRIRRELELAERQIERAILQDHLADFRLGLVLDRRRPRWYLRWRGEASGEAQVVEIGGYARARIEGDG